MLKLKQVIGCVIAIFAMNNSISAPAATSEDITSARIQGVSEFLLERANDNFVYILQRDMKEGL
jgi:hypothetical protein